MNDQLEGAGVAYLKERFRDSHGYTQEIREYLNQVNVTKLMNLQVQ
jgi:hypothetical protein